MPACHAGSGKYSSCFSDGARSMPELQDELEPFLHDAPDELDDAVTGLLSRGWADAQNAVISLSRDR